MNKCTDNIELFVESREGLDLIVYHCGMEKCKPSHSFGPAVRDNFLIHYILDGRGTFYADGNCYKIGKGQGFLICPNVITYYEADFEDPWTYTWVGFSGVKAQTYLDYAGLNRSNPIFTYEDTDLLGSLFEEMRNAVYMKRGGDIRLQGLLSIFLSELIERFGRCDTEDTSYKDSYIKKTLKYIEANYAGEIRVSYIADYIGLNRNYFSSIIKKELGLTLQEYIMRFRMNKACELLKSSEFTISEISRSVGYNDPLGFSKIFKRLIGCPPKEYRSRILSHDIK